MTCGSLIPLFLFGSPVSPFANPKITQNAPLESIGYELQVCKPFVVMFMQFGGGVGVHPLGFANRCMISPREHASERNRVPRPGLPNRKGNHHSRILSAFP